MSFLFWLFVGVVAYIFFVCLFLWGWHRWVDKRDKEFKARVDRYRRGHK